MSKDEMPKVSAQDEIIFLVGQYYDIQKLRVAAFNRIVAFVKASGTKGKPSVLAKKIVEGKTEVPNDISVVVWYHNHLFKTEKELKKRLDEWSADHPVRKQILNRIKGIGPVLSSGIIAWLSPIDRFSTISKLWAYCGMKPGQRLRRGEKAGFNVKLRTLIWKVAVSFEKQNPRTSFYRRIYDEKKKYYANRDDFKQMLEQKRKGAVGMVRNYTLRYVGKRFLADLWVSWRELEGLPVTKPYAIDVMKHTNYIPWEPDR